VERKEFDMAFDRSYQALPEPCQLLEQARLDPKLGEMLQFTRYALGNSKKFFANTSPIKGTFQRLLQDLVLRHPGIEKRNYDAERRQDSLLYLLSEDRRHGRVDMTSAHDMGSKIVNGASALSEHLRGTQRLPLRYSSALEVQEMASYLEGIPLDDLRKVYDPVHMEVQAVYKFFSDRAEQEWEFIGSIFEGLKAFYSKVAAYQEGILVVTD
jgi:Domain of unknown function (DUF1877)